MKKKTIDGLEALSGMSVALYRHRQVAHLLVDLLQGCEGSLETEESRSCFKEKVVQSTALAETLFLDMENKYEDYAEQLSML